MNDPHRGKHRLLVLFIIVAGIAAYAGNLDTYFLKDDLSLRLFTEADGSFSARGLWTQFLWPTEREWDDIWRPVPALFWAAEYLVFGADPTAFHIGGLVWHLLVGVLLYWLVNRLTGFRNPAAGFFAGLLFQVYPLHPEAVLWLTQLTVLMGLALTLAALLFYDIWLHRRRRRHLVLAWVAFALACLSREHALTLPACFVTLALFMGPPRPWARRVQDAAWTALVGALLLAAYFGGRFAIFGRFVGPYSGFPSNAAYAEANRVFERLGETFLTCLVPGNRDWMDTPVAGLPFTWLQLFQAFSAAVAAWCLVRVVGSCLRHRSAAAFGLFVVVFTLTAYLPVWEVFFVNPNLLNARSAYHILALLIAGVATFLVDPWDDASRNRSRPRILVPALLAVVYAVVLQVNLQSWDGASAQVRYIQEALVLEAERHGRGSVYVVFETPSEFKGSPTIDLNLGALLAPPYLHARIEAVPFVVGHRFLWPRQVLDPGGLLQRPGARGAGRRRYYRTLFEPLRLQPLFGGAEVAQGDHPPALVFPADGAIVVIGPEGNMLLPAIEAKPNVPVRIERRDPASLLPVAEGRPGVSVAVGSDLVFAFRPSGDAVTFVIHLDTPELSLPVVCEVGKNAERRGDLVVYGLKGGTLDPAGRPVPWPLYREWIDGALPVQWRVEARDASGTAVGVSTSHRLLIMDGRSGS